jgi:protein-S-isoprenylcysteine O-methyltransferase Ste14
MNALTGSSTAPRLTGLFRRGTKGYDLLAASPLIVWYILCLIAVAPQILQELHTADTTGLTVRMLLDMLSKASKFGFGMLLISLLVIRRTPIAATQGLLPRVISFMGCYLGIALLVLPGRGPDSPWLLLSSFLVLAGTLFAIYSLAWLGRSISIMPESRKLVMSGPYSVVRHPLYLGEQISLLGVAVQCTSPWAIAAFAFQLACLLYRMGYEEQILSGSFPEYPAYMARTSRFIPGLY